MKKKNLLIASVVVAVGAIAAAAAQNTIIDFTKSSLLDSPRNLAAAIVPGFVTAVPFVHDGGPVVGGTFHNTLGGAIVSTHQDGDIVVVMSAEGDLPGALTLKLQRDAGSAITGGEFAFLVSYSEEVHREDGTHGENLINRGTLKGSITGGQLILDADGAITGISNVQLTINGATMEFHEIAQGTGSSSAASINDHAASNGSLTLIF